MEQPTPIVEQLVSDRLFPADRLPVHVNQPWHEGDTPLHDHDFWEAALVVDGHAVHRSIDGLRPMHPGDVVVMQPGQWHAWEACTGLHLANCCVAVRVFQVELAWLAGDAHLGRLLAPGSVDRARPSSQAPRFGHSPEPTQLLERWQALAERDHAPGDRRAMTVARLLAVCDGLADALADRPATNPAWQQPAVRTALDTLLADLAYDWSVAELAEHTGVGAAHLTRLIRRATGRTPIAWLARRRAEYAAVLLLTTDAPVAVIGATVGWPDANYFARRFRQLLGSSPGDYRRQLPTPALRAPPADWIQWR